MIEKQCKTCGEVKPTSHFYIKRKKPITYRSNCKICYGIESAERFRKPEATAGRKESWRKYNRFKLYGITPDDFKRMNDAQDGKCKICSAEPEVLCIDHCHATGVVRGLLCNNCNTGLGQFKDDPKLLEAAIEYLRH